MCFCCTSNGTSGLTYTPFSRELRARGESLLDTHTHTHTLTERSTHTYTQPPLIRRTPPPLPCHASLFAFSGAGFSVSCPSSFHLLFLASDPAHLFFLVSLCACVCVCSLSLISKGLFFLFCLHRRLTRTLFFVLLLSIFCHPLVSRRTPPASPFSLLPLRRLYTRPARCQRLAGEVCAQRVLQTQFQHWSAPLLVLGQRDNCFFTLSPSAVADALYPA